VLEPGSIKITFGRYETKRGPQQGGKKSWIGADGLERRRLDVCDRNVGATHRFAFTGKNSPADDGNPLDIIGAYTYPKPERGPDGSTIVRVRTNSQHKVTKTESLFMLKGVVKTADLDLYRGELD
jgi:hypothetical protein